MKWSVNKKSQAAKHEQAREKLVSKTVLDDLLSQMNGGAISMLLACHPTTNLAQFQTVSLEAVSVAAIR